MFCTAVAVLFGAAFSTWHSFAERSAADLAFALRVWLLFAGIAAKGIVAGNVQLGRYLRLIRNERRGSRRG